MLQCSDDTDAIIFGYYDVATPSDGLIPHSIQTKINVKFLRELHAERTQYYGRYINVRNNNLLVSFARLVVKMKNVARANVTGRYTYIGEKDVDLQAFRYNMSKIMETFLGAFTFRQDYTKQQDANEVFTQIMHLLREYDPKFYSLYNVVYSQHFENDDDADLGAIYSNNPPISNNVKVDSEKSSIIVNIPPETSKTLNLQQLLDTYVLLPQRSAEKSYVHASSGSKVQKYRRLRHIYRFCGDTLVVSLNRNIFLYNNGDVSYARNNSNITIPDVLLSTDRSQFMCLYATIYHHSHIPLAGHYTTILHLVSDKEQQGKVVERFLINDDVVTKLTARTYQASNLQKYVVTAIYRNRPTMVSDAILTGLDNPNNFCYINSVVTSLASNTYVQAICEHVVANSKSVVVPTWSDDDEIEKKNSTKNISSKRKRVYTSKKTQ